MTNKPQGYLSLPPTSFPSSPAFLVLGEPGPSSEAYSVGGRHPTPASWMGKEQPLGFPHSHTAWKTLWPSCPGRPERPGGEETPHRGLALNHNHLGTGIDRPSRVIKHLIMLKETRRVHAVTKPSLLAAHPGPGPFWAWQGHPGALKVGVFPEPGWKE